MAWGRNQGSETRGLHEKGARVVATSTRAVEVFRHSTGQGHLQARLYCLHSPARAATRDEDSIAPTKTCEGFLPSLNQDGDMCARSS